MVNLSVARRYARALLDVASEGSSLEETSDQLSSFSKAVADSPELSDVLLNPGIARAQRTAVLEAIITSSKLAAPVGNLLRVLEERNRLGFLPDIARIFTDLADQRAGRVRGRLTSAVKLPADAVQKLARQLETVTQRKVILDEKVDPTLLGGVSAQVGSVLFDGSLRTQLEELRKTLRSR